MTPDFQRHALCPKPQDTAERAGRPMAQWFELLAGNVLPAERRALREIVEHGDLLEVDGEVFIVARVTPATIDALAAFESVAEDIEEDNVDGCMADDYRLINSDGKPGDATDEEESPDAEEDAWTEKVHCLFERPRPVSEYRDLAKQEQLNVRRIDHAHREAS